MAIFNPQIKEEDPKSYLGLSKEPGPQEVDKSKALLIAGVGETLASGLKAADYVVQETVKDQIFTRVDKERNDYTAQLEKTRADLAARGISPNSNPEYYDEHGEPLAYASGNPPPNILAGQGQDLPKEITGIKHTAQVLHSAKENGKITNSDYYSRLLAIAKEYRARYPGYRELIDQQISSITGVDPANARIRSLTQEINSYLGTTNQELNRDLAYLRTHSKELGPLMPALYEARRTGKISGYEMYSRSVPLVGAMHQYDLSIKRNNAVESDQKERQRQHEGEATILGTKLAETNLGTLVFNSGAFQGKSVAQVIDDARAGKVKITGPQWQELDQLVRLNKDLTVNTLISKLNERDPNFPGQTAATILGDRLPKVLENVSRKHDLMLSAIGKKDPSLINFTKEKLELQGQEDLSVILSQDQRLRGLKAIHSVSPEFATIADQYLLIKGLQADKPKMNLISDTVMKLGVQPDLRLDVGPAGGNTEGRNPFPRGTTFTLNDSIKAIEGVYEKEGKPIPNAVVDKILGIPTLLTVPSKGTADDQMKLGIALGTFDPKNAEAIARLDEEKVDKETGRTIPGRYRVFSNMTSEGIMNEVSRLDKSYPQYGLWNKYQNFVETTFKDHLFSRDIAKFTRLSQDNSEYAKELLMEFRPGENIFKVSMKPWSKDSPYYTEDRYQMRERQLARQAWFNSVERSINSINEGLQSYARMARARGADDTATGAFIVKSMMGYSLNPTNISGIPASIIEAIKKAHEKEKPEEK